MRCFPLEIQEEIIRAGRDNRVFLLTCALVCRDWVPRSRSLLRLSLKLDLTGSGSAREKLEKMEDVIAKPATTTLGGSVESVVVWMGYYGGVKSDDDTAPDLRDQIIRIVANVLSRIRSVRRFRLSGGSLSNNHEQSIISLLAKAFPNVQHVVLQNWECSDFSKVAHLLSQLPCLSCVEFHRPVFSIPASSVKWDPQPEREPPPSLRTFIIHDFDVLREYVERAVVGYAHLFAWVAKAPLLHRVALHIFAEMFDGRITPQMIRALEPLDVFLVTVKRLHTYTLEGGFDAIFRLATSFTIRVPNLGGEDGPSLSEVLLVDPEWPRLECLTLTYFKPPADEIQQTDWNKVCDVLKGAPRMKMLRIPVQTQEFMLGSLDELRDAGIDVCVLNV